MNKKKIVFLTGAGISAESGISTFRDSDGLWENHNVEDVASIDGWYRNPGLVIDFYNERRRQLKGCLPNNAHRLVAALESDYDVTVVTQNVDDLHERGGSTKVIHLHGELTKACNESKTQVVDIGYSDIEQGSRAADGSRLRPFIVWFGEAVPLLEEAIKEVKKCDIMVVVGTSLAVYPAAGLVHYAPQNATIYLIDPKIPGGTPSKVVAIEEKATVGMEILHKLLKNEQ